LRREVVEFVDKGVGGDGALDQAAEAFPGVLVDDGHDLDGAAVSGGIELKVDRPHHVRCLGLRHMRCGGTAEAFTAAPLRHSKALLAPQPLDLFVVHNPALAAGVVIGPAKSPPRMVPRVLPEPSAQRRIGICRRGSYRLVSLRRAVLPGDAAGKPFTDPQHPLEVTNGRPTAFRA